jgi:hypothetical protein
MASSTPSKSPKEPPKLTSEDTKRQEGTLRKAIKSFAALDPEQRIILAALSIEPTQSAAHRICPPKLRKKSQSAFQTRCGKPQMREWLEAITQYQATGAVPEVPTEPPKLDPTLPEVATKKELLVVLTRMIRGVDADGNSITIDPRLRRDCIDTLGRLQKYHGTTEISLTAIPEELIAMIPRKRADELLNRRGPNWTQDLVAGIDFKIEEAPDADSGSDA